MKNIGLDKIETKSVDNFTSDFGIKIRKIINKPVRKIIELGTRGKIIVDKYPRLEKDEPYIFAASHSFCEEVSALLAKIDRNAYTLIGTTDQLEHNPRIYLNWVTGLIYVDREDENSRKEAIPKMEKILKSGSSLIIFPEGRLNNTENLLCQKLFSSPFVLAKKTGVKIVPISTFNEFGSKEIHLSAAKPIDLRTFDYNQKREALAYLRDQLATLQYEQIEKYSTHLSRNQLGDDPRYDYMVERYNEYMTLKWSRDVFDEELLGYEDKNVVNNNQVRSVYENIAVNKNNIFLLKDIIDYYKSVEQDKKYDFKQFMHDNWDEPKIKIIKR